MSVVSSAEDDYDEIEEFTQAELEQLLAPIALYPDTILSHILIAATYPIEIVQAERWTKNNPDLQGSDAVEAVADKDWDPSVMALVAFPQILERLSENLEWTQKLGDAFLQSEKRLLASVQSLRRQADESGNLDKMDKVEVTHEDDRIVIETVKREVVYVPYYDTRVVYGSWRWAHYPPVYWHYPRYVSYYDHHNPFYWGHSVRISFGFFFTSFHWHDHYVVRIPWHHYHPHRYYSRHQIVRHEHARRWAHNPVHRRGVSYRSVTVSNRYKSNRPSTQEIRTHRNSQKHSVGDRKLERNRVSDSKRVSKDLRERNSTRIATPNRIREELRDGKITKKERKSRPVNSTYGTKERARDVKKVERNVRKSDNKIRTHKPKSDTSRHVKPPVRSNNPSSQKPRRDTTRKASPPVKSSSRSNQTSHTKSRSSNYKASGSSSRYTKDSSRASSSRNSYRKSSSSNSRKSRDSR